MPNPSPDLWREASISIEVELKLAAEPADLARLAAALTALAPGAVATSRTLVTTYFDTPERALTRAGAALRVREAEGRFVQTLKTAGPGEANLLARGEWEDVVVDNRPDLQAPQVSPHLPEAAKGELRPLFVTEFTRVAIEIEPIPGTRIEAAVDEGAIRAIANGRSDPVSEVELELKSGEPAALYDLALGLLDTAPLRIDPQSKAERGYRLVEGDNTPAAVPAAPILLDPAMTIDEALQRVGRGCLAHLLRNEPAALAGEAEGLHQMRVAMRRLRSLLSSVKTMVPQEQWRWVGGELAALANILGPARNLDVFATELLPPVRGQAPDEAGWDELSAAAESARAAAYRQVAGEIRSPRHTAAMLRLLRWFEGRGWRAEPVEERDQALQLAIGAVAPLVLDRRRRAVRKRSRGFAKLSLRGRHRLRIAVKKLRYAIELLDSLYDRRDARRYVKRLKGAQDELGHANDVRVAYDLVIELGRAAVRAEPVAAAGAQLLAQHQQALAADEKKLRRRLRRLNRTRPFWRG